MKTTACDTGTYCRSPKICCIGARGRLVCGHWDLVGDVDAVGLLHHARAPLGPGLVADAARGSRGNYPRRQARLLRCLRRRAPDRCLREHHQQHDVPGDADPRHQDNQACDWHYQSCADASSGDCSERRDVRPSVAGPLRHGCERGRSYLGFRSDRNPRPRPQQDFRGGDRRHPRGLGAQPALRHRLSGQPLQGHLRAHRGARARRRDTCQTISEATAGNRRHGGRAVFSGRRPHGETRLSSFIGELPSATTPQVALVKLCQGQSGGGREGQYRRLARGADDLRRRR